MIVVKHVDSIFGSLLPIRLSTFKLVMSYFHFYIYKAIRKVLFLLIFSERSYKGLIFSS